jgi:hypothetical protein
MMLDGMTIPNCAKGTARTTDRLHVRDAPKVSGLSLGILAAGETVTIWAVAEGWAIVQSAKGLTGYASMGYLTPVGELIA